MVVSLREAEYMVQDLRKTGIRIDANSLGWTMTTDRFTASENTEEDPVGEIDAAVMHHANVLAALEAAEEYIDYRDFLKSLRSHGFAPKVSDWVIAWQLGLVGKVVAIDPDYEHGAFGPAHDVVFTADGAVGDGKTPIIRVSAMTSEQLAPLEEGIPLFLGSLHACRMKETAHAVSFIVAARSDTDAWIATSSQVDDLSGQVDIERELDWTPDVSPYASRPGEAATSNCTLMVVTRTRFTPMDDGHGDYSRTDVAGFVARRPNEGNDAYDKRAKEIARTLKIKAPGYEYDVEWAEEL